MERGELAYMGYQADPAAFRCVWIDLRCLEGCCRDCGALLIGVEAIPVADPFDANIAGDDTAVVLCPDCYYKSAMQL